MSLSRASVGPQGPWQLTPLHSCLTDTGAQARRALPGPCAPPASGRPRTGGDSGGDWAPPLRVGFRRARPADRWPQAELCWPFPRSPSALSPSQARPFARGHRPGSRDSPMTFRMSSSSGPGVGLVPCPCASGLAVGGPGAGCAVSGNVAPAAAGGEVGVTVAAGAPGAGVRPASGGSGNTQGGGGAASPSTGVGSGRPGSWGAGVEACGCAKGGAVVSGPMSAVTVAAGRRVAPVSGSSCRRSWSSISKSTPLSPLKKSSSGEQGGVGMCPGDPDGGTRPAGERVSAPA